MVQLAAALTFGIVVLFFLDRNYRVLPDAIHGHMPSHHPGLIITDVTIQKCSSLNPFSSCTLDSSRWRRIEKDLYLGKTWTSSAYIHVSQKREEDLSGSDTIVMDLTVGRLNPGSQTGAVDQWEARPGGIWVKRSGNKEDSDSTKVVTGVDVLFGDDATESRDGWTLTGMPLPDLAGSDYLSAHLTIRRGPAIEPKRPKPRISDTGKFKIMQIADLHLSTGVGHCRDAVPDSYNGGPCEADPRTLDFVSRIMDDERPDFVVLSGDQVNGDTAPDAPSVRCPSHSTSRPRPLTDSTRPCSKSPAS